MKHLHFVGIGGARLRGLAKIYLDHGYTISGSDWEETKETKNLAAMGMHIHYGHHPSNVPEADLVVYTNAVGAENPELVESRRRGLPLVEGAELLGRLMSEIGFGIAIAGTHGKTTTTAMTSLVLTTAGLDPTVLIGGELAAFRGNHRSGNSPYMVVEACEFKRSFLHLRPKIELITNIDWDHPDCFPSPGDVFRTFEEFTALLPGDGTLVVWGDDPMAFQLTKQFNGKSVIFGYQPDFDWMIDRMRPVSPLGTAADLLYKGRKTGELLLRVPGPHNVQNAVGAIAIAHELGVDTQSALNSLAEFTGVKRRFEIKGNYHGALVVDDYAHHPAAVRVTLATARQFYRGRIWCVFQPHLYSRTKHLLPEFAQAFSDADILVLADIYAAREANLGEVGSSDLADAAREFHRDVRYLGGLEQIYEHLRNNLESGDLVITMGAGDIYKIGDWLIRQEESGKV